MGTQTVDFGKYSVEILNTGSQSGLVNENDIIKITFKPSEYFWGAQITNKTDKHLEIDWDKSTFTINSYSSGITFSNTSQLTANLPKGKEVIAPNSKVTRSIYPVRYISSMPPTVSKRYIKDKGEETVSISLLIIDENKQEKYITSDFKITLKK
ncbi:hypothetical protein CMT92_07300 [Elizabethkingia anophelis]|uniref:hypothetical protein n=1 Tax=Elizabethkingia anophelis TaxID=1117645 RepID=UPI0021A41F67|nr:hypothetical protein [Elizabethkingia anophelis]MCT3871761.1 hypothetical protein [Elizabethkingia anophelis]MDV3847457.1 hypothetical protein [Elizabethkingia anophelis]